MVLNNPGESTAFDVLHHNECTVSIFTHFVDGTDVWMVQRCRCLCFSEQSFLGEFISDRFGWQHLYRHLAIKQDILGQEHLTHSARTDPLNDAVMRNLLWNQTS